MSETIGQRVASEILADLKTYNHGWQASEIGARIDALVQGERMERIDATARELFVREISTYGSAGSDSDTAYAMAEQLEQARARFLAAQEPA